MKFYADNDTPNACSAQPTSRLKTAVRRIRRKHGARSIRFGRERMALSVATFGPGPAQRPLPLDVEMGDALVDGGVR